MGFLCFVVQCSESDKKCHLWTAVDLGFFILMGIVGGLLGATFNCLNKRLAKYRMRNVHPKPKLVRYLLSLELVQLFSCVLIIPKQMHQFRGLEEKLDVFILKSQNEVSIELQR